VPYQAFRQIADMLNNDSEEPPGV